VLQRIDKQRLAKTARTGKEHEFPVLYHLIHTLGFVNVSKTAFDDVLEVLSSYWIWFYHDFTFFLQLCKYNVLFPILEQDEAKAATFRHNKTRGCTSQKAQPLSSTYLKLFL
jgi:hypothetical protein